VHYVTSNIYQIHQFMYLSCSSCVVCDTNSVLQFWKNL